MDVIQPSEATPSEAALDDVAAEDGQYGSGPGGNRMGTKVIPGAVPVTLTPKGIMMFLGRKERPRPLLRLVCKACGLSTHDIDPIVDGVCLECLCLS